jgi:hypothetical protein
LLPGEESASYEAPIEPLGVDVLVTPDAEAAIGASGMRGPR